MFVLADFLKSKLTQGFEQGAFTDAQVGIYAANYLSKGWITEGDFHEIVAAITPDEEPEEA
jgi:hypothetical protein